MFYSIGGVDSKSLGRRILSRTFTNEFAVGCSWTGRGFGKNISNVKIRGTLIIQIMQGMILFKFFL